MAGARSSTQRLVAVGAEGRADPGAERARRRGARVVSDAVALHRRGVGQILDTSMDVLVARFGACVGIAALCWLPFRIGTELLWRSGAGGTARFLWGSSSVAPQLLTTSFVCILVGAHLVGHRATLAHAIKVGFTRFPGMVLITFLNLLASIVLVCPCVVTTYAAGWLFAVIPAVYVLEKGTLVDPEARGRGPFARIAAWFVEIVASVRRGLRLVWGWDSFARWLGWMVVANVAVVAPLSLIPGLVDVPQVREFLDTQIGVRGGPVEFLIVAIGAVFVGIGTAYTAVVMTVYYVDQRVRKEGLDLELRLEGIAASAGLEG